MILCFSGTSAYSVLSNALHQWGYQLPFWQFTLGVVIILFLMSLFAWRFSIPSTFDTWNFQWWHHGNFAKPKIEKIEKDVEDIKKLLQELKDERKIQ
jgi:CBS-domain-containing membrane protein